MSKSTSGLFKNTKGFRTFVQNNYSPEEIIANRVQNLDTKAHPLKYKILSNKAKSLLKQKLNDRTITKAEYILLQSNLRLTDRRMRAVVEFWDKEATRIIIGAPTTRNWSESQKNDILHGRKPKHNGKTINAHHTYSVKNYPHLANRHEVIFPATFNEHLNGWHGGSFKRSKAGKQIKIIKEF